MGFLSSLFGLKVLTPEQPQVNSSSVSKLPKEISPFVTEIAGEAQDLYKAEARERL
jgi:hypothetical protein